MWGQGAVKESDSSLLSLEIPESPLHLSPTCRLSRGFVYLGYVGGGRWGSRSGALQPSSLVGYHIL